MSTSTYNQILFVDAAINDIDSLLAGIDPAMEVVLLQPGSPGLAQIAQALAGRTGVDGVHVMSHGGAGYLSLAGDSVGVDELAAQSEALATIRAALSADADLLLYGCKVAEGEAGSSFIQALAAATGADVAASTDLTGAAWLGGDWTLEASTGSIEVLSMSSFALSNYDGTLALPGAHSATQGSEVFLGGNYIELGISGVGSFGTSGSKPAGFFGTSGSSAVGMSNDADGFGTGINLAIDYFLPGTPEERWAVGYNGTTSGGYSQLAGSTGAALSGTSVVNQSSGDNLAAKFTGTVGSALKVEQVHTFKANDKFFKTTVTLTNTTGSAMTDVRFMRSFDPDNTKYYGGAYATVNTVEKTFAAGDGAAVISAVSQPDSYSAAAGATAKILFYSSDSRAYVANFGFSNSNPYDAPVQAKGYTTTSDSGIAIVFKAGTLAAGATVTFSYYTSLDTANIEDTIDDIELSANPPPTFTAFAAPVDAVAEDTQVQVTFADLAAQGDEADQQPAAAGGLEPGTVDAFVVTSVTSGTLLIGTSAGSATAWRAGTNDVIDATRHAYWTPAANANGTLNAFKVVARDSDGLRSATPVEAQVTVSAVNDAPVIASSSTPVMLAAINEDQATVAGNTVAALFTPRFTDADAGASLGGIIVVDDASTAGQGVWQYSTDGGSTWFDIGAVSTEEGLALSATTKLRFVPAENWNGTPGKLTVHITDQLYAGGYTAGAARNTEASLSADGVSTNTVLLGTTVTAVNDLPVFTSVPGAATLTESDAHDDALAEGEVELSAGALSGTLTGTDVEGPVSFGIRGGSTVGSTVTKVGVYGTLTLNTSTNVWSYAPSQFGPINALPEGASAQDVFEFKVVDNQGASTTQALTITLTGTNDLPVLAAALVDQSFSGAGTWTYQVPAATFTDAEGTGLVYSATLVDGSPLPGWLSFDPASRAFSGNPPVAWGDAPVQIRVTATDDQGEAVYSDFELTLSGTANQPPVVANPLGWKAVDGVNEITSVAFTGTLGGTTLEFDGETLTLGSAATGAEVAAGFVAGTTNYDAVVADNVLTLTAKVAGARTDFTNGVVGVDGGSYTVAITQQGADAVAETAVVQFSAKPAGVSALSFDGLTINLSGATTATEVAAAVAAAVAAGGSVWTAAVDGIETDKVNFTARSTGDIGDLDSTSFEATATTSPALVSVAAPSAQGANAVAEVTEVTFAAANGATQISFDGTDVAVLATDSAAMVAARIAGSSFANWNAVQDGTPEAVVFTAKVAGTVTDVLGSQFINSGTAASDVQVTQQGADGVAEELLVTFLPANGATRINFDGYPGGITLSGSETAGQVAEAFHVVVDAAFGTSNWDVAGFDVGAGTVQLVRKTTGDVADLTVEAFALVSPPAVDTVNTNTQGANAVAEQVVLTFAAADGATQLSFAGTTVMLSGSETADQVAAAFAAETFPGWTTGYTTGNTVTLTASSTGPRDDLEASDFDSLKIADVPLATSVVVAHGATAVAEVVDISFTGSWGGAEITLDGSPASAGSALTAAEVAAAVAAGSYGNHSAAVLVPGSDTVVFTATAPGNQTDIEAGDFTGSYTGEATPTVTLQGAGWTCPIPPNTFSDPEGDTLAYSAWVVDPVTGVATALVDSPALSFDAGTVTLSGNGLVPESTVIEIRAFDAVSGGTAASQFQLVVYTDTQAASLVAGFVPVSVPFVDGAGSGSYTVPATAFNYLDISGGSLSYTLQVVDSEGDPIATPDWLSFDTSTGTFTGNPPFGADDVRVVVTATSGGLSASTPAFTLVVDNANDPLALAAGHLPDQDVAAGAAVDLAFNKPFVDPDGQADGTATSGGITYAATANGQPLSTYGLTLTEEGGQLRLAGNPTGGVAYLNIVLTGTETNGGSTHSTSFTLNLADSTATGDNTGALSANNTGTVAIAGTPTQGQTLTAQAPVDADGVPGSVSYQWQVATAGGSDWTDIGGARGTATTLTLAQTEAGKDVRVQAFYLDGGGVSEAPVSDAVNVEDVNDAGAVTVTGSPAPGQTIGAVLSDADGLSGAAPTYQWQRSSDGVHWTNIDGATYSAYTIANEDGNFRLRVVTAYTDDMENAESGVTSAAFGPVQLGTAAPVGVNDFGAAAEAGGVANDTGGSNADGNLLVNDTDPNVVDTKALTGLRSGNSEGLGDEADYDGSSYSLNGQYGRLVVDAETGAYTYTINQTAFGTESLKAGETVYDYFNYTVTDGTGLSDTAVLRITVTGADDAPGGRDLPATATVSEDVVTVLDLATTVLTDVDDDGTGTYTLTLHVANGAAALVAASGGSVTVSGSWTETLVLTGTLSALNAYIDTAGAVSYVSSPNDAAGSDTLAMSLASTAAPEDVIDIGEMIITITPTNDAPIVDAGGDGTAGNDGTALFKPRGGAVQVASELTLSDIDSANLASATVTLTAGARDNQFGVLYETLSLSSAGQTAAAAAGLTLATSASSSGAVLTLTGSATQADYQAVLREVLYNNSNPNAFAGDRTVTISVTDSSGQVSNASAFKTASANGDIAVGQRIFIDGVDSGALVAEVLDSQHFVASRPLTGLVDEAALSFFDDGGEVTTAEADGPFVATVTVNSPWTPVIDMNGSGAGRDRFITVNEGSPAVAVATADASITDQGGLIRTVTVTLVNPLDFDSEGATQETLGGPNASVTSWLAVRLITFAGNGTGPNGMTGATEIVFTASGAGSDATNFQVALRAVTYVNTSNNPDPTQRQVLVSSVDVDGNAGVDASTYINLTAVNDAPVAVASDVTGTEDVAYAFAASDFGFSDPSDGADGPAGSLVSITLTSLPASGTLHFDGEAATIGQRITAAELAAGLLTYVPVQDAFGAEVASFGFRVQDDGGTANGGVDTSVASAQMTIHLDPANDAPVFSASGLVADGIDEDVSLSSNAGMTVAALVADGSITDVDLEGAAPEAVAVTGVDNTNGSWQYKIGDGFWTNFDFSGANEGTALLLGPADSIRFAPAANFYGDVEAGLTLRAWDQTVGEAGDYLAVDGNAGGTGTLSEGSDAVDISIAGVNDKPFISGRETATVNEDESVSISGFTVGDADGDMLTVRVTAEHEDDLLSLDNADGVTVTTSGGNQLVFSGTAAALQAALNTLRFAAGENVNGTSSLELEVSDDDGASWQPYTVSVQGKFFFDFTGHYYEYVSSPGITWTAAQAAAAASSLYGLQGYLATITSAEENAFITPRLGGNGWMGASDAASEGVWRWVTGPEAGQQFWQDQTVETGTTESFPGYTVNGMYANWEQFADQEPNNHGGAEDHAHFYASTGTWNDFPNSNGADGYVIEYGGLVGDALALTPASLVITINPVNDAPVLEGLGATGEAVEELAADNAGQTVASLLGTVTDVDTGIHGANNGNLTGMAVHATAVEGVGTGQWQYSLDDGETWADVAPAEGQALLLRNTDLLRFVPDGNGGATASLSYYAWDQSAGEAGDAVSTATRGGSTALSDAGDTVTLAVTEVNQAPTITPPEAQTGAEDRSLVITGLSFDDVDISGRADGDTSNDIVNVALGVEHGTLTLGSTEGITVVMGANGSYQMWIAGTLSAINAAVASLTYQPDVNFSGSDTLTMGVQDAGNVGSGGPLSAITTVGITVTDENDAPVLTAAAPEMVAISEDDTGNTGQLVSTFVGAYGTGVADADAATLGANEFVGQGIAVFGLDTTGAGGGTWQYRLGDGAWTDVGAVDSEHALLLRSTDSLRFVPDEENATAASASYYLWDGASGAAGSKVDATERGDTTAFSTASDTVSLEVTAVNDAPTISLGDGVAKFNPRGDAVALFDEGLVLADVDAGETLSGASLVLDSDATLDNAFGEIFETLGTTLEGGVYVGSLGEITITGNGTEEDPLLLTGPGTLADYQAAMLTLVYFNGNPNAFAGVRPVAVTVFDSAALPSAVATLNVEVNWGPVADLNGEDDEGRDFAVSYVENDPGVAIAAADASLTDQDGNIKTVTITLTNPLDGAAEKLFIDPDQLSAFAGIGLTITGNNSHVITINGDQDGTYFQLALRAVQYTSTSENPDTTERIVRVTTLDQDDHVGVSAITRINVSAVNDMPTGSVTLSNDDPERDTTDALQGDPLSVSNSLADLDGITGPITYQWLRNGVAIEGETGTGYTPQEIDVGSVISVRATYVDDAGNTHEVVSNATNEIININDAPTAVGTLEDQVTAEDAAFSYVIPDGLFADVDLIDSITLSATLGDGSPLPDWLSFDAGTRTFSGTPANGDVGSITVKVIGTDEGALSASISFTLEVTNVNDAPTLVPGAQSAALVEAGGVSNGTAGTDSASITLVLGDVDSTPAFDTDWLLEEGWSTADDGVTYSRVGTYGTATFTVASGVVSYLLDNDLPATQALLDGEAVSETFSFRAQDEEFSVLADAVFDITGSADTPTVTAGEPTATLVEAGGVDNGDAGVASAQSSLSVTLGDTVTGFDTAWLLDQGWTTADEGLSYSRAGTYGTATLTLETGVVAYVLDNDAPATQGLANGDEVSDDFEVRVTDGNLTGGTTVSFDIVGSNDAPRIVAGEPSAALVEAGGAANSEVGTDNAEVLLSIVDPDGPAELDMAWLDDVANGWTALGSGVYQQTGAYGTVTFDTVVGSMFYVLNNSSLDTEALTAGQVASDGFDVRLLDEEGGVVSTVVFEITGSNDAPTVVAKLANAQEAGGLDNADPGVDPSGELLSDAMDLDAGAVVTLLQAAAIGGEPVAVPADSTAMTGYAEVEGLYGTLRVGADGSWRYLVDQDNATVQALRLPEETLEEVFSFTATDGDGGTAESTLTVTVAGQNDSPTLVRLSNLQINEIAGSNNRTTAPLTVGNLSTDDPDDGESFTYDIIGGADQFYFQVVVDGGVPKLQIKTDVPLNAELQSSFSVVVRSTDALGASTFETFVVELNDINEFAVSRPTFDVQPFLPNLEPNTLPEELPVGTFTGVWARASDTDATNNTVTYSLVGNSSGTLPYTRGEFAIDPVTGAVNVAGRINFEESGNPLRTVHVKATSSDGSSAISALSFVILNVNEVMGTPGNDNLAGGAGLNVIDALAGNDTVVGGSDADWIYGREGDDQLRGAAGDDRLYGGDGNDTLRGGSGDDEVSGGAGEDLLFGGIGNDLIDGGTGTDWADYSAAEATSGATVDLSLTGPQAVGGTHGTDTLVGIENLRGTVLADALTGDAGANVIEGLAGDDVLRGADGNDSLLGGDGNDTLRGGSGDDQVSGGAGDDLLFGGIGNDLIDGGTGTDWADYSAADATTGATVSLAVVGPQAVGGGHGTDTLVGIENLRGTAFADALTGNAGANALEGGDGDDVLRGAEGNDSLLGGDGNDVLRGGSGDDQVSGGAGDDLLFGGIGNDLIDGGTGTDWADYSSADATTGATVSLAVVGPQVVGGTHGTDTLVGIENLRGTAFADALTGNAGANAIEGGAGDDVLRGAEGNDTLLGGDGNDVLRGGAGDDQVSGGAGNDQLFGGLGDDLIDGGTGIDWADYSAADATSGATVSLAVVGPQVVGGTHGTDTLVGIENLRGTAFADVLTGDAQANVLEGGVGDDVLDGGLGNDRLIGGTGSDTFKLSSALNGLSNVDTLADFQSGVDRIELSAAVFTAFAPGEPVAVGDHLQYNAANGHLSYDADGAGAGEAVLVAVIDSRPAVLLPGDLVVGS